MYTKHAYEYKYCSLKCGYYGAITFFPGQLPRFLVYLFKGPLVAFEGWPFVRGKLSEKLMSVTHLWLYERGVLLKGGHKEMVT